MASEDSEKPSKTREGAYSRAYVDERIREIETMMRSGQWVRGRSRKAYAERVGAPVSTVGDWAKQASRLAWSDEDVDERRELKASHIGRLDSISLKAEAAGRFREAASAIRVANEIAGNITPGTTTININAVLAAPVPFEPFGAPAKVEAIMEFARTLFELAMRSDDPKQRLGAAEALRAGRGLPPLVEAKVVDEAGE